MEGSPRIWALNLVRVTVDMPGTGSMSDKASLRLEDMREAVDTSWHRGSEIAHEAVTRFIAWLRVETQQSWLGTGEEPMMQYGRSYLRELDHDGFLIAYGEAQSVTMRHGAIGASRLNLERIRNRLASDEDVPTELELFADARYFARESDLVDGHRAVLAAAMAAEIATKKALLARTPVERRDAVALLLKRRSTITDLVSEIAQVSVGSSLRTDDPELFRELKELNDLRNQIVHAGRRVDRRKAYALSFAVEKLFRWLHPNED
jgi:hypothetical protein